MYADRLPSFLAGNQVWKDLAAALDVVFGKYVDTPTQKLGYIRDVNNFHPASLALKKGNSLLDGNDAYYQGVVWNDPSTRTSLATLVGMNFAQMPNMTDLVREAFIKFASQFYPEQGTPSWVDFLGFTNDIIVTADQLWAVAGPSNSYLYLYPAGDPRIGTPVWDGGTWFPTSHYNITVYTNLTVTIDVARFTALLEFAAPINVVFNQINIASVYFDMKTANVALVAQEFVSLNP